MAAINKYSKIDILLYLFTFIVFLLLFYIYYQYKNIGTEEITNDKCLVVLFGPSFKSYHRPEKINYVTPEDLQKIHKLQKTATLSHIDFINNIRWKYGIDSDIIINTFSDHYKHDIKIWLAQNLWTKNNDVKNLVNSNDNLEECLLNSTRLFDRKYLVQYKFIVFLRCDAYLKPAFFNRFDPRSKKITFASQNNVYEETPNNSITIIPSKRFKNLFSENKKPVNLSMRIPDLVKEYGINGETEIDYFLHEKHAIDTEQDWNPLYRIVGKPEAKRPAEKSTG
jgi:hypothetical protein